MSVRKSVAEGAGLGMGCVIGIVLAAGLLLFGCCGVLVVVGLLGSRLTTAQGTGASQVREDEGWRFGLTEAQRKEAFWEQAEAQNRGRREADEKFGVKSGRDATAQELLKFKQVAKEHVEYAEQLTQKYYREIAERHKITTEQLDQIVEEGGKKRWPLPKLY